MHYAVCFNVKSVSFSSLDHPVCFYCILPVNVWQLLTDITIYTIFMKEDNILWMVKMSDFTDTVRSNLYN